MRKQELRPLWIVGARIGVGSSTGFLLRPLHRSYQTRIWVNGLAPPPKPSRRQLEDRKVQVWRARIRISRRSNEPDDIATLDPHPLLQAFRVSIEVRVVVAIQSHFIELVDCVAAWFAEKQLANGSGYHSVHGR